MKLVWHLSHGEISPIAAIKDYYLTASVGSNEATG